MKIKRINILLREDVYKTFAERCRAANIPMAEVVRSVIEREMKEPAITAQRREAAPKPDRSIAAIRKGEAEARKKAVIRDVKAGALLREVAAKYGMTVSGVSRVLSRAGVSLG